MEQYKNLKKEQLLAVIEELTTTENGVVVAERDALKAEVAELKAKLAEPSEQGEEITELTRQVADLSARLEANEATKGDKRLVVNIGGEPHMIMFPRLQVGDRTVTDKQLSEDAELLATLKAAGSGALVPVAALKAKADEEKRKQAERKNKA